MLLNDKQWELVNRIDCSRCSDRRMCDQIRYECPKVDFHSFQVDDVSILKPDVIKESEQVPDAGFTKTTKRDFETHMNGIISRCRFKNKILSFFSSEKEAQGQFFFSHNERYYKALRDESLTDAVLEQQIMDFLYPDKKSFNYLGWFCKFDMKEGVFHLITPHELEQPTGFKSSKMEVLTPVQAIDFINGY